MTNCSKWIKLKTSKARDLALAVIGNNWNTSGKTVVDGKGFFIDFETLKQYNKALLLLSKTEIKFKTIN